MAITCDPTKEVCGFGTVPPPNLDLINNVFVDPNEPLPPNIGGRTNTIPGDPDFIPPPPPPPPDDSTDQKDTTPPPPACA